MRTRASADYSATATMILLLVLAVLEAATASCILERGLTSPYEHDAYTCIRSKNMKEDLDRLPLDKLKVVNVEFRESKIQKIGKEDLQKLGNKLASLSIVHSSLEDVDEEAFRGLSELKTLVLRRNRLVDAKKAWFKGLDKLENLDLSGNMIRVFDPAIFDLVPTIQEFDISENQLSHYDVDAMKGKWLKLKKVGLQWNPYEWAQGAKVIEYANANPTLMKNSYASIDGLRDTVKLVKECQGSVTKKDDVKELDNCLQGKLAKAIENPKLLEGDVKSS